MTAGCKATHKCNDFAFLSTMFSEYDFFMQTILICPEIPISYLGKKS
ncbi:unknown [Prevotella sp. CAG:255]|nr:unknown [Prevotella sp. CAG:255]